jgi:UPF0176 protein
MSTHKWIEGHPYTVILFYRYVIINDAEVLIEELLKICTEIGILGRILIANEGINGTLAGSVTGIDFFIQYMKEDERFCNIDWKTSHVKTNSEELEEHSNKDMNSDKNSVSRSEGNMTDSLPFLCLSIRKVKEIISSGRSKDFINSNLSFDTDSFGGLSGTGEHLTPTAFHNALEDLNKEDGMLLDIRNQFEYSIGIYIYIYIDIYIYIYKYIYMYIYM